MRSERLWLLGGNLLTSLSIALGYPLTASSLISTLFIHSHVTRYLVFLGGEFSKDRGQKACGQRRCNKALKGTLKWCYQERGMPQ